MYKFLTTKMKFLIIRKPIQSEAIKFCCFIKMETDRDFDGDFHGSEGPIPIKRDPRSSWEPHSEAFYRACVDAGFREDQDANHPDSEGV